MLGEVLGSLMPHAAGVALSPFPVMALVLMLTSPGGRVKAWSFIAGAFLCLYAIATVFSFTASARDDIADADSPASTAASLIRIGLGIGLFFMAYRTWKGLPADDEVPELPGWMQAIGNMSTIKAFGMGALLMGPKPKNLIIVGAASLSIAEADLGSAVQLTTTAIFILMSISLLIALALIPAILGSRGDRVLAEVDRFLGRYNGVIMMVLFIIIGFVIIGNGVSGLAD